MLNLRPEIYLQLRSVVKIGKVEHLRKTIEVPESPKITRVFSFLVENFNDLNSGAFNNIRARPTVRLDFVTA
jgi:hypothetical protein